MRQKDRIIAALLGIVMVSIGTEPTRGQAATPETPRTGIAPTSCPIPVADFEDSIRTEQGGMFFCIGGRPDQVRDGLVRTGDPEAGAWRIEVSADAPSTGAGGVLPLYDTCPVAIADKQGTERDTATTVNMPAASPTGMAPTPGVDVSQTPVLHLRLIGELGQRQLRVEGIAGKPVGPETVGVTLFTLPADAIDARRWRDIPIAISESEINLRRVTGIRLLIEGPGEAWLAVDSIGLVTSTSGSRTSQPGPAKPHSLRHAMWSWRTESILRDPAQQDTLIAFCREQGITDLFSQVLYEYRDGKVTLQEVDSQRQFNAMARGGGIRVHALDGHRSYALEANHPRILGLAEALIRFNEEGSPETRFHGVHLDNEPYLLAEWKNEATRPAVLRAYYELNRRLAPRLKEAHLEFGLDIPFWWDKVDESGRAVFRVMTSDGERPLLEAVFPLVQNVAVMSYRERVTGCNGVVGHCRTEFGLGQRLGVDVFASIETGAGERFEKGTTFGPYSRAYFEWQFDTLKRALSREPGCSGLAVHAYKYYREMLEKQR
ncbi:MAG: hypothetical protein JXB13_15790 [Phycisphaerae bacterium]|nr:hypothetical protein [Phycisphaerae bacterium]